MRTFSIQTLGCKVNHYESEQMARLLASRGWVRSDAKTAELRIVHTCSVTAEAASKSRQAARRAMKLPVLGQTIVTGCWATSDCEEANKIAGEGVVITNHEDLLAKLGQILDGPDLSPKTIALPQFSQRQRHQRAFLKIQDGCDAHCTYCIIPSLRPTLRSTPIEDVVEEARQLVDAGHREIVLTGIFLSAYGQATALRRRQANNCRALGELIDALCTRVRGLRRLRLSSLEPGDMDDSLLEVLSAHSQIAPHFHLPLQSGSDGILRKMNRQYRRDDYLKMIDLVRQCFDRPALTTDIIAGFPGETDADFQQSVDIAEYAGFIHIHAFPFSPRQGTAAARWTRHFIRGPVVGQRIDALCEIARHQSLQFRRQFVGESVEVTVESDSPDQGFTRHGRCERYFDVSFTGPQVNTGEMVSVMVKSVNDEITEGELASSSHST